MPLSGLSIVAVGDSIVVREGQSLRESDTGQYALALEVIDKGGDILVIDKRDAAAPPNLSADEHFAKAFVLEESDVDAARAHYEAV